MASWSYLLWAMVSFTCQTSGKHPLAGDAAESVMIHFKHSILVQSSDARLLIQESKTRPPKLTAFLKSSQTCGRPALCLLQLNSISRLSTPSPYPSKFATSIETSMSSPNPFCCYCFECRYQGKGFITKLSISSYAIGGCGTSSNRGVESLLSPPWTGY